jgi:hypothetical protein
MAESYNYIIDQGADSFLSVQYKDSAGVPINLAGYTASMQFRPVSSNTTALNLTSSSGITITTATGTLAIHVTAAQSAVLAATQYDYELEITSSAGIVTRLVQGLVTVDGQLTP